MSSIKKPRLVRGFFIEDFMEAQKIERIRKLEREVQDFHPLLRVLFSKIPTIRNVEYRQGPDEKGADFVLEKCDDIIQTTKYIGTVVKIGKINSNLTEIERQIDECGMERYFENGKKRIFINEIWVITNDTITENAREKIHHKFKNTSIEFFDAEKIKLLIDRFYPEYWTDITAKLGEYIRKTRSFTEKITKNSALIEFQEKINIEQKILKSNSKIKPDQGRKSRKITTTIHEAIKNEKLVFLEGLMGSGKSNLIKRAIEQLITPELLVLDKQIPIAITFKEFRDIYNCDLSEVLNKALDESNTATNEYSYIFFIDGIDEVQISSTEKIESLSRISSFINNSERLKAIVTSRTIEDLKEKNEIDKRFARYEVLPLTTRQLVGFIEKACNNPTALNKLTSGIERSPLFKTLPKTPISAILLARILNEDPSELPSSMTELYSKYSELVLGRWDMSKGLQSQKEYEVIDNVCIEIGHYIINNNLDTISASEAKDFFSSYIIERNIKIDPESIFQKFLSKKEIISYINKNLTIRFKHRTFAEFFAAKKITKDNSAVIDRKVFDPYWCTVFFFFVGLRKDCPELIEAIINTKTENPAQSITKIFQTPQYLLAGHLTPYTTIKNGLKKTYQQAAELLLEGIEGRSPISALAPMQLTYIFTHTMCAAFGYEYFNEAIQEAIFEKLANENSELETIELFLLCSTNGYLGKNYAFDDLITEHGPMLPEYLKLGIKHVSDDFSLNSSTANKYIKKLQKNLKTRTNISELIKRLYETPANAAQKQLEKA